MALPKFLLPLSLALLMLTALLEMALISSMVYWLHRFAGGEFAVIAADTSTFTLHGKPKHMLLNHGHASNGAAGTAFVGVGLGGILVLYLRKRAAGRGGAGGSVAVLYHAWVVLAMLSALLSLGALVATFTLTYQHWNQWIDRAVAAKLVNQPYPHQVAYPLKTWTPEYWYVAVLRLPLVKESDRRSIHAHLTVMRAWRWNLIALVVLGIWFTGVAVLDAREKWRERRGLVGKQGIVDGRA